MILVKTFKITSMKRVYLEIIAYQDFAYAVNINTLHSH